MPRKPHAGLAAALLSHVGAGVAAALVALGAAGCTGDLPAGPLAAAPADPAEATRTYEGELVVHILDFSGHSEFRHFLKTADGKSHELRFPDGAPELGSGTALKVVADEDAAAPGAPLTVRRFKLLEAAAPKGEFERRSSSLVNAMKKKPKKWAFILVDIGGGVRITKEEVQRRLFSSDPTSVSSYFREVSYGIQELSGDVLGPFKTAASPMSLCANFGAVVNEIGPTIQGVYDQYLWFFGSRIQQCPWAGVAQLGTAARATKHSAYNGIAECVVLVQEPGHNFGMVHSSAIRCSRGGVAVPMVAAGDGGTCQHDEYGNPFDPMGGGSGMSGSPQELNRCYHMNGVQKAYQGWLGGCNIVKATTSGIYTVYPLEQPCNGIQMLQVPLPAPRSLTFPPSPAATLRSGTLTSYYVEFRAPVGLDARLGGPRVFVVGAGNLREAVDRGNPNWLIDMTPETRQVLDAHLPVGKTFTDPAANGPKITVLSADNTKAVIQVQLEGGAASMTPGGGTCDDGTAFQAPGPSECSGAPAAPPMTTPTTDAGGGGYTMADASAPDTAPGSTEPTPGTPGRTDASLPTTFPDAGLPRGPVVDGSAPPTAQPVAGNCGCRVGDASAAGAAGPAGMLLVLAGLVLSRRRRRR